MMTFKSIGIVGYGNVATQLAKAFIEGKLPLHFIAGRDEDQAKSLANTLGIDSYSINEIPKTVDLLILAISDDAIKEINIDLPNTTLVCHTSGSKPVSDIKHSKRGVFYALQTFTKEKQVEWNNLPFLIEAEIKDDEQRLISLAKEFTNDARTMNSTQRKTLHLSAVISCNFTNFLWIQAEKLCKENNIEFSLLLPLIKETSSKIENYSPRDIQTGPAKRKDQNTIKEHIDLLNNHSELAQLYTTLSKMIQKEFE